MGMDFDWSFCAQAEFFGSLRRLAMFQKPMTARGGVSMQVRRARFGCNILLSG